MDPCEIVSATVSPDFSSIIYTTVGMNFNMQGIASPENYETIYLDLRVFKDSTQYVLQAGKDYQRAQVLFLTLDFMLFYFIKWIWFL